MARKTKTKQADSPVYQTLFKAKWIELRGGSKVLGYDKLETGIDLLRPIKLEEIQPRMLIYRRSVYKPNEYYPMFFYPGASWDTIKDEFSTGRLFTLKQKPETI